MTNLQRILSIMVLSLTVVVPIEAQLIDKATNTCYSSYHIEQEIGMSVTLESVSEQKKVVVDTTVHIKALPTPEAYLAHTKELSSEEEYTELIPLKTYLVFVNPNFSKVNGNAANFGKRYVHPFLVHVNANTGELFDYQTTQTESAIISEYLSYFDFFQYSLQSGDYVYRNGNGKYNARISQLNASTKKPVFHKTNRGYKSINKNVVLINNSMIIKTSDESSSCFYLSASVTETFKNKISKSTFVEGEAQVEIVLNDALQLPKEHYFHGLSNDISTWPTMDKSNKLSYQQAQGKLPVFLSQLDKLIENKQAFLLAMKSNKALWIHLAQYISSNENDKTLGPTPLVNKMIWALDRINSTESVAALTRFAIDSSKQAYVKQSIFALAGSSAQLDNTSLALIKEKVETSVLSAVSEKNALLLVRALGIVAKQRDATSPIQSADIKKFLYSQMDNAGIELKASLFESIGSLGETIDQEGLELLLTALDDNSKLVPQFASKALVKVPYKQEFSDFYINKLNDNMDKKTKGYLIELLGNANNNDLPVKTKLLNIVASSVDPEHGKTSLISLKKINYSLEQSDIKILKNRLRKENDKASQKLLASLILEHQRRKWSRHPPINTKVW